MILNADDFDCVANGRWLRGISVAANSSTMAVPAGSGLGEVVGASISIPGAADLHATIQGLPDRKVVEDLAMEAGFPELTFSPTAEMEPFVRDHEGWRIVVEGAGPNGQPLLTDIEHVGDTAGGHQVLTLADPAATATVAGATAVANDGSKALLSNHARASVGPLTISIGDRQVADATMTVGSKVLRSATARFSRLDLGKPVLLEGAGHQVTTIQGVVDDATLLLADPALRPVVDGSADVWRPESDSTKGWQDMLGLAAQAGNDPVEITFGPGVYDFTATTNGLSLAVFGLNGLDMLTISGSGRELTVLRLMPEQDLTKNGQNVEDTHVLMAKNCHRLKIADLTIHGAYLTMARGGVEQMHGVFLSEGCDGIDLDDIEVFQSGGDGVRLLGEPGNRLRNVRVDRCRLIQNHRSGVAIQRDVVTVRIRGCHIDMTAPGEDACIDLEPSKGPLLQAPHRIDILSNTLVHGNAAMAVSLSGISVDQPARHVVFSGNSLIGGRIGGGHNEHLTVRGNMIDAGSADLGGSMMGFHGRCVDLRVTSNQILAAGQPASGITLSGREGSAQVRILDNVVRSAGAGIDITVSGDDVDVADNDVVGAGKNPGVRVRTAGDANHEAIRVRDNSVREFGRAGIIVGPGQEPDKLIQPRITGNTIDRQPPVPSGLIGIELVRPTGQWSEPVVEGNQIGAAIPVPIQGPG